VLEGPTSAAPVPESEPGRPASLIPTVQQAGSRRNAPPRFRQHMFNAPPGARNSFPPRLTGRPEREHRAQRRNSEGREDEVNEEARARFDSILDRTASGQRKGPDDDRKGSGAGGAVGR
jgi:hypothetical protein